MSLRDTFQPTRALASATLLASLAIAPAVWAQATTPGQVSDTLKRPVELKLPEATSVTQPTSAVKPSPVAAKGKSVTLAGFEFTGNTVYSTGELVALLADYLNRPVTLLDIYAAADRVAEFYVGRGYTLASVNVPPQKISDGVVTLEVTEGRVSQVKVEGHEKYNPERLRAYLNLPNNSLFQGDTLDAGMRRINDLPGLKARAVIQPGETYGTSEIVIKAEEKPISGALFADNHGRETIGKRRIAATVTLNNPLGVEDQLQLLGLLGSESLLNYYYAAYSLPLNDLGTRVAFSYGHAGFTVLKPIRTDGRSDSGKVEIQHPLLRSMASRADLSVGASRAYSDSRISGIATPSGTAITLFELGTSYSHQHSSLALTQVTANMSTNFDRMDAADVKNPATGAFNGNVFRADQIFRGEIDLQHLQPIAGGVQLLTHVNAVWSPERLPDTSSYSIGGPQSVRGYAPSEVRGDRGYFAQLQFQRRFALGQFRLTPRFFVDSGWVSCADDDACITQAAGNQTQEDTLTSVGIGSDIEIDNINIKLDWSLPTDQHKASDGRDDNRLYGAVFMSF